MTTTLKKSNSGNSTPVIQRLTTAAEQATARADAAKLEVRAAKAGLKKARKSSKLAKKAAKLALKKLASAQAAPVAAGARATGKRAVAGKATRTDAAVKPKAPARKVPPTASAAEVARSVIKRLRVVKPGSGVSSKGEVGPSGSPPPVPESGMSPSAPH